MNPVRPVPGVGLYLETASAEATKSGYSACIFASSSFPQTAGGASVIVETMSVFPGLVPGREEEVAGRGV